MGLFSTDFPPHLEEAKKYREERPKGTPYSIACEGPEKSDRTKVYRHWRCKDGPILSLDPSILTAHDMFETSALRNGSQQCLGSRPYDHVTKTWGKYQWLDYETVRRRRAAYGVGLVEIHHRIGDTRAKHGVGLWCNNRPEWQLTDLACMSQSLFSVSIYDSLGPDVAEYIINHAELTAVAAGITHIPALIKIQPRCPTFKIIISLDKLDTPDAPGFTKRDLIKSMAAGTDLQIFTMEEVEALGASLNRPYNPPSIDDIITINYTSGTTGDPKGVVLTHKNAVAATSNAIVGTPHSTSETVCSFLPLAHIFARMAEHAALWGGVNIGYFHGEVLEIVEDFKAVKPTILIAVPRLLNRMGGGIKDATIDAPGVKGAISRAAVSAKMAKLKRKDNPSKNHLLYDRIWSKKVKKQMGMDNVRTLVSGAAPLDPSLHDFLRIAWGSNVCQGYGLTEGYASTSVQQIDDLSTGNIGSLLPANEACLQSIPDMDYFVTDKPYPRGELLLRGNTIMSGYYKNPEETANTFTDDGWLKTGDVAMIDDMGRIYIIDRKKNVLKLAQGEYIAPEKIEGVLLSACKYLAMGFVHGDSNQRYPIGLFGIQPDLFAVFASKILNQPITEYDVEAIQNAMRNPKILSAVQKDIESASRSARLAGFERPKAIKLYIEPFSIENGLLTPTLKLKRSAAAKEFRNDLDDLYAQALEKEGSGKVKAKL